MKYKFFLPAAMLLAALAGINLSGCGTNEKTPDLIVVDFSQEYPVMDLKLSDIAEVSYIPLQGKDSARLLSRSASIPGRMYIDDEHLLIGDFAPYRKDGKWHRYSPQEGCLLLFDSKGEYLNTVFRSKNEDEDILFGINTPYAVYPRKKEIYAFSGYGKFIRGFKYDGEVISTSRPMQTEYRNCIVQGDTLALLSLYPKLKVTCHNVRIGESFILKTSTYAKPDDSNSPFTASHITITETGAYITTPRTDTVYHLNRNLEIVPAFLNVRHTEDANNLACPLVETEDYILLGNIQDEMSRHEQRFRNANYIYMKAEKQIYRLPWEGESILNENNTTLTPNTLVSALPIPFLKENYNLLPNKLKHICDAASSDDNPVLMVMRFGKNDIFTNKLH